MWGELGRIVWELGQLGEMHDVGNMQTSSSSGEVNPLTPNDPYRGRTVRLTSKRCILYIYSTNIGTEYFKLGI